MKFLSVLFLALFVLPAHARVTIKSDEGGITSGGGGGILCDAGKSTESLVTADYYETLLPYISEYKTETEAFSASEYLRNSNAFVPTGVFYGNASQTEKNNFNDFESEEEAFDSIIAVLYKTPSIAKSIIQFSNILGPIQEWKDAELNQYKDHDLVLRIPENCKYVQIAVRKDDVVFADKQLILKLKPAQRALIRIHEALYYAAKQKVGLANSSAIRNFISLFIEMILSSEFIVGDQGVDNNWESLRLCGMGERIGVCTDSVANSADLYLQELFSVGDSVQRITRQFQSTNLASRAQQKEKVEFDSLSERYFTLPKVYETYRSYLADFQSSLCSAYLTPDADRLSGVNTVKRQAKCFAILRLIDRVNQRLQNGFSVRYCAGAVCKTNRFHGLLKNPDLASGDQLDLAHVQEMKAFVDQYLVQTENQSIQRQ